MGNATFRIDTVVGGNQITLTPQRQLKCKYTFASVAQPGFNLVWKSRKTSSEILCTDQPGIQIARLSYRNLNCTKDGRVEIFDQTGASGSALDEIVVSGIALAHMILVINLASLGAAAA